MAASRIQLNMTNKQFIRFLEPKARLDYYESLRNEDKPCWFIRLGWQGKPLSAISATPKEAWLNAVASFNASFPRKAA